MFQEPPPWSWVMAVMSCTPRGVKHGPLLCAPLFGQLLSLNTTTAHTKGTWHQINDVRPTQLLK